MERVEEGYGQEGAAVLTVKGELVGGLRGGARLVSGRL